MIRGGGLVFGFVGLSAQRFYSCGAESAEAPKRFSFAKASEESVLRSFSEEDRKFWGEGG